MTDLLHGPVQLVLLMVVLACAAWFFYLHARRSSDYVRIALLGGLAALLGTKAGSDGLQIVSQTLSGALIAPIALRVLTGTSSRTRRWTGPQRTWAILAYAEVVLTSAAAVGLVLGVIPPIIGLSCIGVALALLLAEKPLTGWSLFDWVKP